jgi:protein O-mannosyl-transferase
MSRRNASAAAGTPERTWYAHHLTIAAVAIVLACQAYSAAMHGPFLFDDLVLPFASPFSNQAPLLHWVSGVRPVLMLTYWLNFQSSELSTYGYHVTNVLLHALNALLVFAICRRLFAFHIADSRRVLAASALTCALFLLHPLQTESVAYVAGRSEVLSGTFVLAAWLIYVRTAGSGVTGRQACAILVFFGLAAAAKEQSVGTIPALLLLTDWTAGRGSLWDTIRANKRLYLPLCAGVAIGIAWVVTILLASKSAGPSTGISPLHYLFTECRAVLVYLRLFFLPAGQNFDRDFPISQSLFDQGAAFAMAAILVASVLMIRQAPLTRYGWFLFLAFLAPTSSIVPLTDPFAEHRMYLPIAALSIAVSAAVAHSRVPVQRFAMICAACSAVAFFATAHRSAIWSDGISFWQDVVEKSPRRARGYQHLAHMYVAAGRCKEAVSRLEAAKNVAPRDYFILLNWAEAHSCAGNRTAALEKLYEAARLEPTADVYGLIADSLFEQGRTSEAGQAFAKALAMEPPGTDLRYVYMGNMALVENDLTRAVDATERALAVNPYSPEAAALVRRIRAASATREKSWAAHLEMQRQPEGWPPRAPSESVHVPAP